MLNRRQEHITVPKWWGDGMQLFALLSRYSLQHQSIECSISSKIIFCPKYKRFEYGNPTSILYGLLFPKHKKDRSIWISGIHMWVYCYHFIMNTLMQNVINAMIKCIVKINFFSIANIGGLMSLFLGFSVLSIAELVYYVTCRPYTEYRKKRQATQTSITQFWLRIEFIKCVKNYHRFAIAKYERLYIQFIQSHAFEVINNL